MSPDIAKNLPESDTGGLNFNETELTLGLPGESNMQKSGVKRRLCDTVELNRGRSSTSDYHDHKNGLDDESDNEISSGAKCPPKAQVVGWPPVRSYRKNMMMKSCKYVKVAVDGAPYLRKVDLETYGGYHELLDALENMFTCLTICNLLKKRKLMDPANGIKYVPTYEDKDGDWMLLGDVPWKMFVESCKRLRLMKSSEAIGLVPMTSSKTLSISC